MAKHSAAAPAKVIRFIVSPFNAKKREDCTIRVQSKACGSRLLPTLSLRLAIGAFAG